MDAHDDKRTPILVTADGTRQRGAAERPAALLPGAFNPVHAGHWGLAQVAQDILGVEVAFELSVRNVDKAELDAAEIERRLAQFRGRAPVWLTLAARFLDKAGLFPGTVFVVGADTAQRVLALRYHDEDPGRRAATLQSIRALGCRFLVAARCGCGATAPLTLPDLDCPAGFADLFTEIPAARFRLDLSSSELRNGQRTGFARPQG